MKDVFGIILKDEYNCAVVGDFNFDNAKDYEQNIK